jgi:2-iminobutanoate/2-iminopropanoate deaminase
MSTLEKKMVSTEKAPKAVGPYSQAIRVGQFLFLSGQIPLDPVSGTLGEDDIKAQTRRVLQNIHAVLQSQSLDFKHVVKVLVFLKDMEEFQEFNEVYAGFLSEPYPARSTVEVARLPKDVRVEIEAIAHYPHL